MNLEFLSIYVLPSEENKPPQAHLIVDEKYIVSTITWSADSGTWITQEGLLVPESIAKDTTEHARNLGVEI